MLAGAGLRDPSSDKRRATTTQLHNEAKVFSQFLIEILYILIALSKFQAIMANKIGRKTQLINLSLHHTVDDDEPYLNKSQKNRPKTPISSKATLESGINIPLGLLEISRMFFQGLRSY